MAAYEIVKFDKAGLMLEIEVTPLGGEESHIEAIHGPFLDANDQPIDIENGTAVDAWARDWVDERYDPEAFKARAGDRPVQAAAAPVSEARAITCTHCENTGKTNADGSPPQGWTIDANGLYQCPDFWRDYLENGIVRRGRPAPERKEA